MTDHRPTEIDFLRHYGLDRETVALLRETYGDALLPVQELAILRHRLFEGGNMVISSPTSSGKTLVGEIACLRCACQDQSSIFLVPTKALAREKFHHFRRTYGARGFHVVLSTRDDRRHDADIRKGRYHIAVIVYEKLRALLSARPALLRETGLLVVDELQTVFDPHRGPGLEVLITGIRRGNPDLQIVGLSAVLGHSELEAWLDARLVEDKTRAVPLRQGVICGEVFHYRDTSTGQRGEEPAPRPTITGADAHQAEDEPTEEALILHNAVRYAESGEQTLVFLPMRYLTTLWARRLAAAADLPPAANAMADLEALEPTHARELLLETLRKSVAFHNSDLTWPERRLIEHYTATGEIRLLASTNTLAEGVNLPVVNVLATRESVKAGARLVETDGPPPLTRISKAEFQNMIGRAGRLGHAAFGRGILCSPWKADVAALFNRYIDGPFDDQAPMLFDTDLTPHVLQLLAAGSSQTVESLADFFRATLSGRTTPERTRHLDVELTHLLGLLADAGLAREERGRWKATDAGRVADQYGLSPHTATAAVEFLRDYVDAPPLLWLLRFLTSQPEGEAVYVPCSAREWQSDVHWFEWLRRTEADPDEPLDRPSREEVAAIKKALLLADWLSEEDTLALEERYGVLAGALKKTGEAFGWMVRGVADLATVAGCPEATREHLDEIGRALTAGCPAWCLDLARAGAPGLTRGVMLALFRAGCRTETELLSWDCRQLGEVLPERLACRLYEWLHDVREEAATGSSPAPSAATEPVAAAAPESRASEAAGFRVDEDRPDIILVNGLEVPVTRREWNLMRILVRHQGKVVSYDRIMEAAWDGAIVQNQQINSHKRQLAEKIERACGKDAAAKIKTVRGVGLRLEV